VLSSAHLRGQETGRVYDLDEIVNELAGHALVLTGDRKDPARLTLEQDGPDATAGRQGRPSAGLLGVEGDADPDAAGGGGSSCLTMRRLDTGKFAAWTPSG
jgi:hypothetical protein